MSEQEAKLWMSSLTGQAPVGQLPDSHQIWLRAQLDASFEPRRKARATLVWIDAAVHSGVGLAVAGLSLWLIGMVGH
jgi:hypothetical protein